MDEKQYPPVVNVHGYVGKAGKYHGCHLFIELDLCPEKGETAKDMHYILRRAADEIDQLKSMLGCVSTLINTPVAEWHNFMLPDHSLPNLAGMDAGTVFIVPKDLVDFVLPWIKLVGNSGLIISQWKEGLCISAEWLSRPEVDTTMVG